MATITSENAKQIRDPMKVHITFEAGEKATVQSYTPTANKSYDATLGNTSMSMRKIADLQDGGFPLDGTCEWYEAKEPSGENGKLGLRSTAGQDVSVAMSATKNITNLTIVSTGVEYIEKDGQRYYATGLDVVPIGGATATLTFHPADANGRVFINYIIPGAAFEIRNDNLINCNVVLRTNLSADNPSWEESELEVQFYYPYDISEALAYIQDDWPLTYEAGYSDEMSMLRKFYLSEPGRQEGNVITLHGVDASSLMDEKLLQERIVDESWEDYFLYVDLQEKLNSAGIRVERLSYSGDYLEQTAEVVIAPEQSVRDWVMLVMNLTATLPENLRYSFVDAGIPTLQVGEEFTNVWEIDEEDIAELVIETPRHVNRVVNSSDEYKFDVVAKPSKERVTQTVSLAANQLYERDFDTSVYIADLMKTAGRISFATEISFTPTRGVWKVPETGSWSFRYWPILFSGGVNQYTDGTGLPGVPIEMDPPVKGRLIYGNTNILSPKNLLNRPNRTIQFKFKGDPRMQPRDFLQLNRLDGSRFRTRIATIETTHEGGGTMATITAQETNLWKGGN